MPYAVSYDTTVSASVIGTRLHIPVVALTCVLMGVSFNCVSASVIGTRLHIPVALTCVLMGVYVLLLKWGWVLCQSSIFIHVTLHRSQGPCLRTCVFAIHLEISWPKSLTWKLNISSEVSLLETQNTKWQRWLFGISRPPCGHWESRNLLLCSAGG